VGVRRGGLLLLAALCLAPPPAAAEAPRLLEGEARGEVLRRLQARQQPVAAVRAEVVQRKRHPLLKAEAVRAGRLVWARPGRLRWEVDPPDPLVVVADDPALLVYRPDRGEAERRDLRESLGARAALEFLVTGLAFDLRALERRFQVEVLREPAATRLRLTPRSRWLAQALAAIEILQPDAAAVPTEFTLAGPRGDRTVTRLEQVEVNPRLAEDAFVLRLGPEVRVVDLRRAPDGGSDR
jgi:outer membrane lipoprotein-sorting protein